jgi:hypothetical protein
LVCVQKGKKCQGNPSKNQDYRDRPQGQVYAPGSFSRVGNREPGSPQIDPPTDNQGGTKSDQKQCQERFQRPVGKT